jgi:hypothetical protein
MHTTLAAILLLAPLCAQQTEPEPPTPKPAPTPLVTLEVAGPAGLRDAFLATNLGNLIGGDESKAIWSKLFLELAHVWHRSEGATDEDTFPSFHKLFAGYRGRIRVRLFALKARSTDLSGVVEFLPDGKTDLTRLSLGLRQFIVNATNKKTREVRVDDLRLEKITGPLGQMTLPTVHRDRVVLFLAQHVETAIGPIERILAGEIVDTKARFADGPIRLQIDMAKCREVFAARAPGLMKTDYAEQILGWSQMKRIDIRIAPRGPHIRFDFMLEVKERFGGLFRAMFPKDAKVPAAETLPNVPRWSSLSLSYQELWAVLTATSFATAEDLDRWAGFDIKEQLIDNLKPGFTMLGDDWSRCCLIFETNDGAAVETSLHRIFHDGELRGATESQHRGVKILTRPTRFDHDRHSATHAGRYLLGFGDAGRELLEKTIDASKDPALRGATTQTLFRTRASRPPGCNGIGVIAANRLHQAIAPMLLDEIAWAVGKSLPGKLDTKYWKTSVEAMVPLFAKYKLDDVVWYTGRKDRRLHIRFVW